jgi:hypothetical protein
VSGLELQFDNKEVNIYKQSQFVIQGCSINIRKHLSENAPLFIDRTTNTFVRTTGGVFTLSTNQAILLACTGVGNFLENVPGQLQSVEASCVSGQMLKIKGINYASGRLSCHEVIFPFDILSIAVIESI